MVDDYSDADDILSNRRQTFNAPEHYQSQLPSEPLTQPESLSQPRIYLCPEEQLLHQLGQPDRGEQPDTQYTSVSAASKTRSEDNFTACLQFPTIPTMRVPGDEGPAEHPFPEDVGELPSPGSLTPEAYEDSFSPSLPSLVSRSATPDMQTTFDGTDAASITSGDTVSIADTMSDQFESEENFEHVNYSDLPDHMQCSFQREQDEPTISMSETTIVPPHYSSTIGERLAELEAEPPYYRSTNHEAESGSHEEEKERDTSRTFYREKGLNLLDTYCHSVDQPLRVLFVADENMGKAYRKQIVAKLASAVSGYKVSVDSLQDSNIYIKTGPGSWYSNIRYIALIPEHDTHVAIAIERAVGYKRPGNGSPLHVETTCRPVARLDKETMPDYAVIFHDHQSVDYESVDGPIGSAAAQAPPRFPQDLAGMQLIEALTQQGVPLLELCADRHDASAHACMIRGTCQGQEYWHLEASHDPQMRWCVDVPIPFQSFINGIDDDTLGLHLAWISQYSKFVSGHAKFSDVKMPEHFEREEVEHEPVEHVQSPKRGRSWVFLANLLAPFLFMAVGYVVSSSYRAGMSNPAVDLASRREALELALEGAGIRAVDVKSVLHYPTHTAIMDGATTTTLAMPTSVDVYAPKSDQIFVSLPKTRSSAHIGVLRNNQALEFNTSRLIDGVYALSLRPCDAYGQVFVSVLATKCPQLNETVKVDLGNRFLQRKTYESAAMDVQKTVQQDITEAQAAVKAVQSKVSADAHSAMKFSYSRARAVQDKLLDTAAGAIKGVSLTYRSAANVTSALTNNVAGIISKAQQKTVSDMAATKALVRNTTAAVGSMVGKQIPGKADFGRARLNAMKIRAKLPGGNPSSAPPSEVHSTPSLYERVGQMSGNFRTWTGTVPSRLSSVFGRNTEVVKDKTKALSKPLPKLGEGAEKRRSKREQAIGKSERDAAKHLRVDKLKPMPVKAQGDGKTGTGT